MGVCWQAAIAGGLAGLVGLAELVTRYRSDPIFALQLPLAWLYVGLNVATGAAALLIVRAFGWDFGQTSNVELWRIMVAGFGATAFFRSSLFVTKVGETEVNVGPSQVLKSLLDTFDRGIDRECARRLSQVTSPSLIGKLDPDRVMSTLPVLCIALMQNFPPSDQAMLAADIGKVRDDGAIKPKAKMNAVIVQLAKHLGVELVSEVLKASESILCEPTAQEKVIEETLALAPAD